MKDLELSLDGDRLVLGRTEPGFGDKMRVIAEVFWKEPMGAALHMQFDNCDSVQEEMGIIAALTHSELVQYALSAELEWDLGDGPETRDELDAQLRVWWGDDPITSEVDTALAEFGAALWDLDAARIRKASERCWTMAKGS